MNYEYIDFLEKTASIKQRNAEKVQEFLNLITREMCIKIDVLPIFEYIMKGGSYKELQNLRDLTGIDHSILEKALAERVPVNIHNNRFVRDDIGLDEHLASLVSCMENMGLTIDEIFEIIQHVDYVINGEN